MSSGGQVPNQAQYMEQQNSSGQLCTQGRQVSDYVQYAYQYLSTPVSRRSQNVTFFGTWLGMWQIVTSQKQNFVNFVEEFEIEKVPTQRGCRGTDTA